MNSAEFSARKLHDSANSGDDRPAVTGRWYTAGETNSNERAIFSVTSSSNVSQ